MCSPGNGSKAAIALLLSGLSFSAAFADSPPGNAPQIAEPPPPPEGAVATIPGGDLFGFTTPTDLGEPGENGLFLENQGAFGKRDGIYGLIDTKLELSRTPVADWWVAGSVFGEWRNVENVSIAPVDKSQFAFDGLSFEIEHRILERSATNPLAVSVSVEPRWGLVDPAWGERSEFKLVELKMFADAVVIPDQLYWGGNLNWAFGSQVDPERTGHHVESAVTNISTALTWQATPHVFLGAEAKYLAAFHRIGFWDDLDGSALFLGPTAMVKFTDKVALTLAFEPQVFGHAIGAASPIHDLDDFTRSIFRAGLAAQF